MRAAISHPQDAEHSLREMRIAFTGLKYALIANSFQLSCTPAFHFSDLLNALDSMPLGGQLRVELENVEIGPEQLPDHPGGSLGQFVRIRVADTGQGMKPAVRARISEAGFTTKDQSHAPGLGLASVFAVVEQHRGWIECSSHTGRGTRFDLYFPRCDGV